MKIENKKLWLSAWERLEELWANMPAAINEERVNEYHLVLNDLQTASGEFLNEFRIPNDKLKPKAIAARRRGYSGAPGFVQYSKDKYCDGSYFAGQMRAVREYLKNHTQPDETVSDSTSALTGRVKNMPEDSSLPASEISIFISHSSQDKALADALTELLKNALEIDPRAIRCTSVEGHRLPVGAQTGDRLKQELLSAKSFIALLTPHSMSSTWVLFELGARWAANKRLAPLLAAGLTTRQLGGPLPDINALSCDSDSDLHQFVSDVADVTQTKTKRPELYTRYLNALKGLSTQRSQERHEDTAKRSERRDELDLKAFGDAHYYIREGEDIPYCPTCYGTKKHLIVLSSGESFMGGFRRQCPACKNYYYEKPIIKERYQSEGFSGGGSGSWMR